MNNSVVIGIAWFAVLAHVVVGVAARRRSAGVAVANMAFAMCVLAYWVRVWYGYVFGNISWSATDQLVPLYAVVAVLLGVMTLSGRLTSTVPNWIVFGIDGIVSVAAALFFTWFRIDRLI